MEASSIITQASRDDEQLKSFVPDGTGSGSDNVQIKNGRGLWHTLFCCFGKSKSRKNSKNSFDPNSRVNAANNISEGNFTPPLSPDLSQSGSYLLPPIRHQDMYKKCMVIDLDETLVHSSFKAINNADFVVPVEIDGTVHQVYVLKRPHVDEFLQRMGELYECVLFTASLAKYADPVADLLDQSGVFRARLFRESCVFYRGNYVKDLNKLGRALHKVVIIDNSPASYVFHPDNAVPINSWFDDMTDKELLHLIPFFENLSKMDSVYPSINTTNHPAITLPNQHIQGDNGL